MPIKFDILNRFTGSVQFSAEIECSEDALPSVRLGLAVRVAVKSGADLSGAYLSGAHLSRAYLSGANLSGANLSGAHLSGAHLSGAYLSRAHLSGADLSGAYLSGADLSGAHLSGANLSGAYLSGANLSRAHLSGDTIKRWVASARRSDGYEFIAFETEAGVKIKAGCRWFTPAQFKEHVSASYAGTPKAAETLAIIAFIETRAAQFSEVQS